MITLKSKSLTARILPFGASLTGLWFRDDPHSLVIGSGEANDYLENLVFSGALVGPVANRIANSRVIVNDHIWQMEANEGRNSLHSGSEGLHARWWDIAKQSDTSVTLKINLRHGDCGLPGNRLIEASYSLSADSALIVDVTAQSDRDTVMNIAHHPYWNLDGAKTIAGHHLEIPAECFLPVDKDTLPTGEVRSVSGTHYDFRSPKSIPVHTSLDANLCLTQHGRPTPKFAASLQGANGRRLQIETTEPGLQLYNGGGLAGTAKDLHPGQDLGPYCGVALEPQGWPDAPHHPNFPSIALREGDIYRQSTIYRIS